MLSCYVVGQVLVFVGQPAPLKPASQWSSVCDRFREFKGDLPRFFDFENQLILTRFRLATTTRLSIRPPMLNLNKWICLWNTFSGLDSRFHCEAIGRFYLIALMFHLARGHELIVEAEIQGADSTRWTCGTKLCHGRQVSGWWRCGGGGEGGKSQQWKQVYLEKHSWLRMQTTKFSFWSDGWLACKVGPGEDCFGSGSTTNLRVYLIIRSGIHIIYRNKLFYRFIVATK